MEIDIILTNEQHKSFAKAMATEGYSCIDDAVKHIHSENASASREDDLHAIRALIQSRPGGFATLNTTVSRHLHRWFESHGIMPSAQRIHRTSFETLASGSGGRDSGDSRGSLPDKASSREGYIDVVGSIQNGQTPKNVRNSIDGNEEQFGFDAQ